MGIKRELLLRLAGLRPGLRVRLSEKYSGHILTPEEADWHGLSLPEAIKKQAGIERMAEDAGARPAKEGLRRELLDLLKSGQLEAEDITGESPGGSEKKG